MRNMLFFDSNAGFGRFPNKHLRARWSMEHLLEDMDLAGISGALVYHKQAIYADPMRNNLRLLDEIECAKGRLFPCWVVGPHLPGDFPSENDLIKMMQKYDVRAVRLDPLLLGMPLQGDIWTRLIELLRETQTLCVISRSSFSTQELFEFLDQLKGCPVLLLNQKWAEWRLAVNLMQMFPNVHMDFSAFQSHYGVEFMAEHFGIERCLFGTGLPGRSPGTSRGYADFSLLDKDAVAKFSSRNLITLLRGLGSELKTNSPSPWTDEITLAVSQGNRLPCEVWDAHCHILPDNTPSGGLTTVFPKGDAAGMLRLRERCGIDRTAIMSWEGPVGMDTFGGNDVVAAAVKKYPQHYMGVATYNPEYDNGMLEQHIIPYHRDLKFPGLKTFPSSQCIEFDDPLFYPWYEYANAHNLYLVFDPVGSRNRNRIVKTLSEKFPNMGLHIDHCGQSWPYACWAVETMKEYPNTWAQMNFTAAVNGVVEFIVSEVGADRVLFGTDSPMRDPRPQVTWLAYTRLNQLQKAKIFGLNFKAIIQGCRF